MSTAARLHEARDSAADAAHLLRHCIARLTGDGVSLDADPHASDTLGEVTLLPHQREGARRLRAALRSHGGALLADETGLGKTYTALAAARDERAILVVAPASLRDMWERSARRCGVTIEVTSYERLSAGSAPDGAPWSLVILDEAHHARSPATRRYRLLARLTQGARVLCLTATPIHNRLRDLTAPLALFLGAGAEQLDAATLAAIVIRRRAEVVERPLPRLGDVIAHDIPLAPEVLDALRTLPPPLPPADGGVAQALVALQLTRAWCSSDAALLAAIRRRLATAAALEQSLACERLPSRRDLALWTADADGSVQLALPELFATPAPALGIAVSLDVVRAHARALRSVREMLRGGAARDDARLATLARVLQQALGSPSHRKAVVFTHSVETADRVFRALMGTFRMALLTGTGARLASGPVARRDVLAAFAPDGSPPDQRDGASRIDVLVATDVVSEGIDLQRAAAVVHLDLPWTMARLEQRMGRIRRIGSPHEQVEAHLVSPPADAEALASTLRHLARKAALTHEVIGVSSILAGGGDWPGIAASTRDPAPTVERERIITLLRQLAHRAGARAASGGPIAPSAFPVVRRWILPRPATPTALALVSIGGVAHLLAGEEASLSIEPGSVRPILARLLAQLGDRDTPSRMDRPPGDVDGMVRRVLDWCERRTAALQLLPPTACDSPAHRRVLHLLDQLPTHLPRAARARLAARAAEGRRLVQLQAGAGAETTLQSLAAEFPARSPDPASAERWLDALLEHLRRPASPSTQHEAALPHSESAVAEAVLVVG